jgi:hypothetical protein
MLRSSIPQCIPPEWRIAIDASERVFVIREATF